MTEATARKPRTAREPVEDDALSVAHSALAVSKKALEATHGLDGKLDKIIAMLGTETEDGHGGYEATGLLGRVRRVEATALGLVRKYQGWFQTFAGFGSATFIFGTVLWFLTKGKIAAIFGA